MITGVLGYSKEDIDRIIDLLVKADMEKFGKTKLPREELLDRFAKWDDPPMMKMNLVMNYDDELVKSGIQYVNSKKRKLFTYFVTQSRRREVDIYIPILIEPENDLDPLEDPTPWLKCLDKRIRLDLMATIVQSPCHDTLFTSWTITDRWNGTKIKLKALKKDKSND